MKKFGFDLHGVIDSIPETFSAMTKSLVKSGHEVHILTGSRITEDLKILLKSYDVEWTHLMSIVDYNISKGVPIRYDEKGDPWIDDKEIWDKTKAEYCQLHQIDLHIDDTTIYNDYFKTPFARIWTHNNKPKGSHKDRRHLA